MAKYEVDPVVEIQRVLGQGAARKVMRAIEGGRLSPGRLARLAEGFSAAAVRLKERARESVVLDQGRAIDFGVVFSFRKGYVRESLDQKAAKLALPRSEYPELYSEAEVEETIQISVGPAPESG